MEFFFIGADADSYKYSFEINFLIEFLDGYCQNPFSFLKYFFLKFP